jgi:hypothetical protein
MQARVRVLAIVLLGLLVRAPALFGGFLADDYGHQLVLSGAAEHPSLRPWNLYDFGSAPAPGEQAFELGTYPWWVDGDWKVRFLRPLASLSLWLDHALYGGSALGYHATSLLFFGLILWAAHALYLRLGLGPGGAALALFFLAAEDGSSFVAGWIANRNTLVEALCVLFSALVVLRAPRIRARTVALSLGLAACAALAKESGLVAFVFSALLLARRRDEPLARRGALLAAVALLGYLVLYVALGYGSNSIFYPTPWGAPASVVRGLVLLGATTPLALSSPFAPDVLFLFPRLQGAFLPYAVVLALAFLGALAIAARREPRALPLALLAGLAILPQASAPISDRLLLVPMLGFAGLLALFVQAWSARGGLRRLAGWLVLAVAGPISLVACGARSVQFLALGERMRNVVLEADVGAPEEGPREALLLNVPSAVACLAPISTWLIETGDEGVRFWPLQLGRRELAWTRIDEVSFELELRAPPEERWPAGPLERVFLTAQPFDEPPKRWQTALFQVEALEASPSAARARFHFPAPLEAGHLRFLAWQDGRLRRIAPPPLGETLVLPPAEPLFPFLP